MSDLFGGGREKEARQNEQAARSQSELQAIANQFLAQLIPGSAEYNEFISRVGPLITAWNTPEDEPSIIRQLGSELVSKQQGRIGAGEPATGLEARTDLAFKGLRDIAAFTPEEQSIFNALRGIEQPGGEGAALTDVFGQLVQRARTPEQFFESTFAPELQLLQEQVKSRAASRGILGSGLELENLGRAGVDLAIKQAQQKETFRQNQLQNLFGLFDVGQGLRGRQIGVEAGLLNLQQGRESKLGELLGRESSLRTSDIRDLLGGNLERTQQLLDLASAQDAKRSQQTGQAIGTALGAGAGFLVGGPPGAAVGAGIGGRIGGGFGGGGDVTSLLGASRQPSNVTGLQTTGGVTSLTRQPTSQQDELGLLLKLLQSGQVS